MSSLYGLTPAGFVPKQQQQIIAEINQSLQGTFGANISLGAQTVFGQLVGIFSEREALLWQLAEAVYVSQFPSGAEGVAVDNLLALNNLRRLPASPTVTNPNPTVQSNGVTLYGLVLYGTPGTRIPAGSVIKTASTPQQSFTLDNDAVISSAVNAQQVITLSNTPNSGAYVLSLTAPSGSVLTTPSLPYVTLPNTTLMIWRPPPTTGSFSILIDGAVVPGSPFPYTVSAASLQSAIQSLGGAYSSVTVAGSIIVGLTINWAPNTFNPLISIDGTIVALTSVVSSGMWALTVGGTTTTPLAANATAAQVQAALVNAGYPRARVSMTATGAYYPGPTYIINWVGSAAPSVSVTSNTTGSGSFVGSTNTLNQPVTTTHSLQAQINNLFDPLIAASPFSDVTVSGTQTLATVQFGGMSPQSGAPSSASRAVPAITVVSNSLASYGAVTNVAASVVAAGSPAQAVSTATNTQPGPFRVLAGDLQLIGSPVAGWSSVTNQLDALTGANAESDATALARRQQLLANSANGPLQSIVQKVASVNGVTSSIGFQNVTDSALQLITFSPVPTTGTWALIAPTGTTSALAYNASSAAVQTALSALPGLSQVQVSGSSVFGYIVDFAGSMGGQAQPLLIVSGNTTGTTITVGYGRAPKSFEIVVQGGANKDIATAIYNATPAGIYSYGTPAAMTTGNTVLGSTSLTVAASSGIVAGQTVSGLGVSAGASVVSVSGTSVVMSTPAVGTYSSVPLTFNNSAQISDAFGNPIVINFSRPTPVLFYVAIGLTTDQYRVPGNPASGVNTQARFSSSSIAQIQSDIVAIGNRTPIGGTVIGFGTQGLVGAFNEVPGILGYSLNFGASPSPTSNANIQLLPTQIATFQTFNVSVTYV